MSWGSFVCELGFFFLCVCVSWDPFLCELGCLGFLFCFVSGGSFLCELGSAFLCELGFGSVGKWVGGWGRVVGG